MPQPLARSSRRPGSTRRSPRFADSVFINCPFDREYSPIFEAIVFCIVNCGLVPRCALEDNDSGRVRLAKIEEIIRSSKYAIHDLSRIEATEGNTLPRFNMSFELGLDLGCRFFGAATHQSKRCLILEAQKYRYQATLSDIAGQDIRAHSNSPAVALTTVCGWLRGESERKSLPGPQHTATRFDSFCAKLPELAARAGLDPGDIQFVEYVSLVEEWLRSQSRAA